MIAVHAGAGYHSPALEPAYKRDLSEACRAGAAALAGGGDALAAVAAAIKVLEDSTHCNAGRGSNLSFGGVVECDASVMAGDGTFGAVAAAPGIQHPIEAAALLARESRQPLSNGRVRPMMLAGDRAREWALSRGLPAAATMEEAASTHVTERAQRQWRKYRGIVDGRRQQQQQQQQQDRQQQGHQQQQPSAKQSGEEGGKEEEWEEEDGEEDPGRPPSKRSRPQSGSAACSRRSTGSQQQLHQQAAQAALEQQQQQQQQQLSEAAGDDPEACCLYDTVGCVALAPDGSVAAGVSSGGIVLKTEGRVGEAAVYGAGCWAQQQPEHQQQGQQEQQSEGAGAVPAVACSVTGVGERVMRHLLARECCLAAVAAAAAAAAAVDASDAANPEAVPEAGAEIEIEAEAGEDVPLVEVAEQLLQRSILRGPPPHDCGLLCLRAQPLGAAGGDSGGGSGGAEAAEEKGKQQVRQPQQQQQQQRYAVEVAVAHTAQSMAFGHMTCPPAAASHPASGGRAAAPAVLILRQQGGQGSAAAVHTYMHGTVVQL